MQGVMGVIQFMQPYSALPRAFSWQDECDEGWLWPDCLECAVGFSGKFCLWPVIPKCAIMVCTTIYLVVLQETTVKSMSRWASSRAAPSGCM